MKIYQKKFIAVIQLNILKEITIMKNSFFIGIHTGIKKQQQQYVIDTFNEFISKRIKR